VILPFDKYLTPVLELLQARGATKGNLIPSEIAKKLEISDSDRNVKNARGTNIFNSRIHWATQYLFHSKAITRPERGVYEITNFGVELLNKHPDGLNKEIIEETDGIKAWARRSVEGRKNSNQQIMPKSEGTPQEQIEASIDELESSLAQEIVSRIQEKEPEFLETIVLELLKSMGYGVGEDSLEHVGGSGDEGVDGVINQDALGLQRIYVQAKRYKDENKIGRPQIQGFMGALQGHGAVGGIFITTSSFSQDAKDFANKQMNMKIKLIDGHDLGSMLVRNGVGVRTLRSYHVRELDENFFPDDE
jgi:restriction system protein